MPSADYWRSYPVTESTLAARVERLEAALREIAAAYDGYDTWSHTTQRRMLRAVEAARAALGDAT